MQLALTEDQELIAKTAKDFVAEESPVSRFRELRDSKDAMGFSKKLWKEMSELGWVGIPFAEEYGGAGMGMAELVLILEALGAKLAPEPFLSSVVLGGSAIEIAGSDSQKQAWLPGLIEGEKFLTLAHQEAGARYDLGHIATRAERHGEGWKIDGAKSQVLDGHVADLLIIPARTTAAATGLDGITLFLVEAGTAGLGVTRQTRLDHQGAALVTLDGVEVGGDAVLGAVDGGGPVLAEVIERGTVALGAEMLGGMSEAFALTLDYLKTRTQFDVPIGSFQGLKHRAANLFMEIELSRSTVMAAARALDEKSDDAERLVSVMKARCSDAYVLAGNEGVQMFGGVGMTDEYDIGFYMKRARAAELTFGDARFHRDRWARLSEY